MTPSIDIDALKSELARYERENRKLTREITRMEHAIAQEKIAYTTVLNQQKASTYIIRERERYLMLLLANSPSIILFLNHAGRIEFCTEYFVGKVGLKSAENVNSHTVAEILAPFMEADAHSALLAQSKRAMDTNLPITLDVSFDFRQDGTLTHFDGLLVPMNDESNETTGLMIMLHDVTDLKRSREEALSASHAKSHFLSNMSHEIRTPMNAIIGMTSIGKSEPDPARKNYAFERIENASMHLLGVINDILDISKIESGKMELSCINFSFRQMIDTVTTVVTIKMQDKRQHFSVELDPAIPDRLFGDDQHLAQVMTNLLSNATKFTPEGGDILLSAKLDSYSNDSCTLLVQVQDSGIGLSAQEQSRLFNAFQQAESGTARKYGGTGLGLAISKRLIELMGGEIGVASEKGKGACFSFTVTLGIPSAMDLSDAENQGTFAKNNDNEYDFTGKVILVVDDVDINLEIIDALLQPTKITVETALTGRKAVDLFAAQPERYDMILMDMQMPGIDGLQATEMIRALPTPYARTVPIIAMTANVFKEDIDKCIASGMNHHLGKPIVINDVMRLMVQYLQNES